MHFRVAGEVFIYLTRNQLQHPGIQFQCVDTIWIEFPRRSDFYQSRININMLETVFVGDNFQMLMLFLKAIFGHQYPESLTCHQIFKLSSSSESHQNPCLAAKL